MIMGELAGRPVAGLQYMLRQLAQRYPVLPEIAVDGVFGEVTLEAVMLFQREFYPPVTGSVDGGTWEAIRELWLTVRGEGGEIRGVRAFPPQEPGVEPGEHRDYLALPQMMFGLLGKQLEGVEDHVPDGLHASASAANVRWLQRAAGEEETGIMDRRAWELLSRLYELLVVAELRPPSLLPAVWG